MTNYLAVVFDEEKKTFDYVQVDDIDESGKSQGDIAIDIINAIVDPDLQLINFWPLRAKGIGDIIIR